jgi:hypothetical protein
MAIDEHHQFLVYLELTSSIFHDSLRAELLFDELARQMALPNR